MTPHPDPAGTGDNPHARQAPEAPPKPRAGIAELLGALCLICAALAPNVLWIARDRTPWPWDQAWYGEVSVDLWFNLTHSILDWGRTMLTGINMKPPGIVWLGQLFVPFGPLCGSIETALLFSVLLTQAVTLYLVFQIGRTIAPVSYAVPAVGVSVVAAAQAFVGLSHQFFVEPLQMLAIAWIVLIAVRCTEWPSARVVLHLAAALVAGVLAKATTPVYCLLPCLYIGFVLIRKPLRRGWRSEVRSPSGRALLLSLGAATPLAAMWYAVNWNAVIQHMRDSSSGEVALHYGFRASVGRKLVVWLGLMDQSFLSPYLGWVLVLAVVIGLVARYGSRRRPALPPAVRATAVLSALQVVFLLLAFSLNDAVESRYMYPMLVFLAVILMSFCAPIPWRAPFVVMFALCGLQFAVVHRVALGAAGTLASQFPYLTRLHADWGQYRELERVVGMTSTATGRFNVVGVEEPWMNANTASFFAAKHRLDTGIRSYYTSLGYAQKDVAAAVKRVEELNTMYYITLDERSQSAAPNFLNLASRPMLEHVRTDPHFEQVSASNATGVVIFRRHE
jgi:hypothetical protein